MKRKNSEATLQISDARVYAHTPKSYKDVYKRQLKEFVRKVRFDRMGAFAYSEEEGTYAAAEYEDSIPQDVYKRQHSNKPSSSLWQRRLRQWLLQSWTEQPRVA